jgi:anti-sigma B factor antagonist
MEIHTETLENNIIKVLISTEKNSTQSSGKIELDIQTQSKFIEIIDSLLKHKKTILLIDITNINYIDSSGLWALFESHKKAAQKNGKLILINPEKDVKRLLDITKMSTKISTFKTNNEALRFLKNT